jgi:hypothetical protein
MIFYYIEKIMSSDNISNVAAVINIWKSRRSIYFELYAYCKEGRHLIIEINSRKSFEITEEGLLSKQYMPEEIDLFKFICTFNEQDNNDILNRMEHALLSQQKKKLLFRVEDLMVKKVETRNIKETIYVGIGIIMLAYYILK